MKGTVRLKKFIESKPPKNDKYYIIAIDGRGGAGKTALTKYLEKLLPDFTFIYGDDYFEHDDTTIAWGSFNDKRFFKDVISHLQRGDTKFTYRPYDWHKEPHTSEVPMSITQGILIERSYSFAFDLDYDLKIWADTPKDLALQRGQDRDEMPLEEGLKIWQEVWQPKESEHVQKVKPLETADIVIDGTRSYEEQLI